MNWINELCDLCVWYSPQIIAIATLLLASVIVERILLKIYRLIMSKIADKANEVHYIEY